MKKTKKNKKTKKHKRVMFVTPGPAGTLDIVERPPRKGITQKVVGRVYREGSAPEGSAPEGQNCLIFNAATWDRIMSHPGDIFTVNTV